MIEDILEHLTEKNIREISAQIRRKQMGEKFWAVWRKDGGAPPSKRHETKDSAINEAARLAQNTNTEYFVLEVIGVVAPIEIPVNYFDLP